MTIEEAIQHCKEQAAALRMTGDNGCAECAAEHEQLAEWLTELKQRREAEIAAPPKSNADLIRQMTDDELAKLLTEEGHPCNMCAPVYYCGSDSRCVDGVLLWLKQEVCEDAGTD